MGCVMRHRMICLEEKIMVGESSFNTHSFQYTGHLGAY